MDRVCAQSRGFRNKLGRAQVYIDLVYSTPITVLIFQRPSSQPFCGLPRCTVTPAGRARACGAPTIVRIRDRRHSWRGGNQTKKLRIPLASSSGYGTQRKSKFEEPQWLQTFAASKSHICSINKRVSKTSHRLRLMASRDREAGTERPPCYLNLRPSVRLLSARASTLKGQSLCLVCESVI